ncbi:minor capsid protein [Brevibacillus sp. MER 51]|uniref:minor capsid protein n=1 Tax=Brevibacillus sp. MER 51 TaxID=2939560 RepID=UPI00203C6571|nr:minor capsid protein [Brevibacillus sp. MER 51]MCM3143844.1 phage head morphogenesis protein [Brevibacillus sp. MER 51]
MSREERYQEELEARIEKHGVKLKKLFSKANKSIVQEITDLYARFAESGQELVSLIYNAARLDHIMTSIKTILHTLRMEEEQQLRITWAEEYNLSLFHHLYFLEQDAQVEVRLPQINTGMVLAALERPWKGRHFSKRIRMRTDLLAAAMEDVITQGAVQGWGVSRTAKEITKRTSESWSSAQRLARTELNRAAAQGQTMAYQANSDIVSEKEFCATLDKRTSSECRKLDGKRYPLDYDTADNPGREGERIPNHPNCRSYWRPVLKSKVLEKLERERSYRIDQERGYTSARTYEEWRREKGISV